MQSNKAYKNAISTASKYDEATVIDVYIQAFYQGRSDMSAGVLELMGGIIGAVLTVESVVGLYMLGEGLLAGGATAAVKGSKNLIPKGKAANHLFKGANKLADTPANRALIENISNGKPLVVDKFGKSWYRGVDASGNGVYSYTQNGVVKGAGYTSFNREQLINHIINTVGVK